MTLSSNRRVVVLKMYIFDITLFPLIYFLKTFLLKFITCGKHTTLLSVLLIKFIHSTVDGQLDHSQLGNDV